MSDLISDSYISFVNLDHRKDRLAKMQLALARQGIEAFRTPGLRPLQAMDRFKVTPERVRVMMNRTPGAVGCHFSQVVIMEQAWRQGKHAWIMEDDLVFCADFRKRLEHIQRFTETHPWDIIWLGGTFHVNPPWWHKRTEGVFRDAAITDDPRMMRTFGAFCTYAYIVNRTIIRWVLRELDAILHTSMGIDWAMIQLQPQLRTYAFVPGCIKQYDNQSDIGNGVTVFSGFSKLGPYWYQERLEDFNPTAFNWQEAGTPHHENCSNLG